MTTDKKINILFTILAPEMGGAERLVYNLIKDIDRELFHPSLAYFQQGTESEDFEKLEIPIYCVPIKRRVDFRAMNLFASIVRNQKIDIVNAHLFKPFVYSFWGCKIKNKIKLIYTEHSAWEVNKASLKWRILGHYLLNKADKVIGISEETRKALAKVYSLNANKTLTINNGVTIANSKLEQNNIILRKALGLNPDEKLICMVANYRTVKNHIMLLKAFNLLLKEYDNVRLLLIGQGFESEPTNSEVAVRDYVHSHKISSKVLFLGYRNDVGEILKIIDIFCLTSLKEGLPISLLEAMAAKLPVVGTNVIGIRDLISDSENGFLVNLNDLDKLKEVLLLLLRSDNLRLRFGIESLNIVEKKFTFSRCISEYEQLFYALVLGESQKLTY